MLVNTEEQKGLPYNNKANAKTTATAPKKNKKQTNIYNNLSWPHQGLTFTSTVPQYYKSNITQPGCQHLAMQHAKAKFTIIHGKSYSFQV